MTQIAETKLFHSNIERSWNMFHFILLKREQSEKYLIIIFSPCKENNLKSVPRNSLSNNSKERNSIFRAFSTKKVLFWHSSRIEWQGNDVSNCIVNQLVKIHIFSVLRQKIIFYLALSVLLPSSAQVYPCWPCLLPGHQHSRRLVCLFVQSKENTQKKVYGGYFVSQTEMCNDHIWDVRRATQQVVQNFTSWPCLLCFWR